MTWGRHTGSRLASLLGVAVPAVGLVLFVESLRVLGFDQVLDGVARVGWGFAIILVLSGARDAARAFAWTRSVGDGRPLPFLPALRARLAGEALNTLLPMGVIVGEPIKASRVTKYLSFRDAARGLAVEFACYSASLAPLFTLGVSTLMVVSGFARPTTMTALAVAMAGLTAPMARQALRRLAIPLRKIVAIAGSEVAYQLLSIAELYYTLRLISPFPPALPTVLILETVNRAVTMVFKMVPLRVGVDEASSSFAAARLHVDPAAGLALALVRKLRLLFWSGLGLALLVRRPAMIDAVIGARRILARSVAVAQSVFEL